MQSSLQQSRLDLLMEMLATMLPDAGIDQETAIDSLRRAFAKRAELEPETGVIGEAMPLEGRMLLSHLLAVWAQSGEYCDDDGQPLSLPANGPSPSLEALYQQAVADMPDAAPVPAVSTFDRALEHLAVNVCIEEMPDGRWRQLESFFTARTFKRASPLALIEFAIDFLDTSHINYRNGPTRFQRVAQTPRFPAAKLPKINQLLEEHGMEFLRLIDSYITAEVSSLDEMEDPVQMGVGVYIYRRDKSS